MMDWMPVDRDEMLRWYRRNRARSRALFDLLADDAYYQQPIALRHPIVFYEGHLPGFSFNTLVKRGLGRPSIDAGSRRSSPAASIPRRRPKATRPSGPTAPWWNSLLLRPTGR
jgi:hypothetical protein